MGNWSIKVLNYGVAECPKDVFTIGLDVGLKIRIPYLGFLLQDGEHTVLVDTGINDRFIVDGKALGGVLADAGVRYVLNSLEKQNVKPEDIEIVLVTHLHYDHIALARLYKNARFIVQKTELEYALNPHPLDAFFYDRDTFEGIDMDLVEGEKEIIPGVSVFQTPGHTPGGQSVEIETVAGKVIIAGLCAEPETFEVTEEMTRRKWAASAPLIHQDVRVAYDSVLHIKNRGGMIIAMHDPAHRGRNRLP